MRNYKGAPVQPIQPMKMPQRIVVEGVHNSAVMAMTAHPHQVGPDDDDDDVE